MCTATIEILSICEWLGWEYKQNPYTSEEDIIILTPYNTFFKVDAFNFKTNYQWQWLCIDKAAKDNNTTITQSLVILEEVYKQEINTSEDLYKAILAYIKH